MYENITYAELKNLPKDQKADAWRELNGLYATRKELAEKLGVSPSLVYNMISRYVKEDAGGEASHAAGADEGERAGEGKRGAARRKMRPKDDHEIGAATAAAEDKGETDSERREAIGRAKSGRRNERNRHLSLEDIREQTGYRKAGAIPFMADTARNAAAGGEREIIPMMISVKKTADGGEIRSLLARIGGALSEERKYFVDAVIIEDK